MSVVVSIFIVALAIAAMVAIRLYVFRRALDEQLKAGQSGDACNAHGCFRGCDTGSAEVANERVRDPNALKRSDSHAS